MFYFINIVVLAVIPIILKIKRKRFALLWMALIYILMSITYAVVPPFLEMTDSGVGDPQLMAGQISENLVASMLASVVIVPAAFLIFWVYRAKVK